MMTGTWEQLLNAGYTRVTWPGWTGYLELKQASDGIIYRAHDAGNVPIDKGSMVQSYGDFAGRDEWVGVDVVEDGR